MSVSRLSYIEFKNAAESGNLMWKKFDGSEFDKEYLDKVIEVVTYIGNFDTVTIVQTDDKVRLEYKKYDRYISYEIYEDGHVNGYIAIGAWDNQREFSLDAIDQLKKCISLLVSGPAESLQATWRIKSAG